jgi:hypothetical protein
LFCKVVTELAARLGDMRTAYKISVGKPEERDHSEDMGIDGG